MAQTYRLMCVFNSKWNQILSCLVNPLTGNAARLWVVGGCGVTLLRLFTWKVFGVLKELRCINCDFLFKTRVLAVRWVRASSQTASHTNQPTSRLTNHLMADTKGCKDRRSDYSTPLWKIKSSLESAPEKATTFTFKFILPGDQLHLHKLSLDVIVQWCKRCRKHPNQLE